ncbi:UDP-N-acetylmuramate--L-alanine ligase [Candidatus Uhrbacteria bacterium]|nr:UDP-N-acetylmuramate--L-alanine ligase [Candidatus Uhrbacteria bacterium]
MTIHTAHTIHMIGIKGVGMTALAEVLHGWGKDVRGSDVEEVFMTDAVLARRGIPVRAPFDAKNVQGADLIIYSTAYSDTNPEFAEAKKRGIPMHSYPEALGQFLDGKYGIAVAGSHGKTTTTALLGHIMTEAGLDPTVIVGSVALNWNANARVGKSEYVVIEADEYQNKFQYYNPKGLLITNIDWDHPDFFKTPEAYQKCFDDFRAKVVAADGWVVETEKINYSPSPVEGLPLALSGDHNKKNLALVWAAAKKLGIKEDVFWPAVQSFRGTARRFEVKGEWHGVTVIDDYAHHPTEIQATLKAARERFPGKKIWTVFHPHTFSRTAALLNEFAGSFADADHVIVLDIYGSAREAHGGVHARDLVQLIGAIATYIPTIAEAAAHLRIHAKPGDVIITMGAGDVWRVGGTLLASPEIM